MQLQKSLSANTFLTVFFLSETYGISLNYQSFNTKQ